MTERETTPTQLPQESSPGTPFERRLRGSGFQEVGGYLRQTTAWPPYEKENPVSTEHRLVLWRNQSPKAHLDVPTQIQGRDG